MMVAATMPTSDNNGVKRNPKRLVILCDGSWQSANKNPGSIIPNYPTNIVRLTRAIKPTTWTEKMNEKGEMVPTQVDQVTYYQSGVGTGLGDFISGGAFGFGLSEKIRAAYGFLANNYVEGDTIAIFGFSRGAYTARAIGGLITNMGLLTKRGMDNFAKVYDNYYDDSPPLPMEPYGIFKIQPGTIEVIGVFDTVGFHIPLIDFMPEFLRNISLSKILVGEQYELENTELPDGVKYAFHALSLDEARYAFRPTLWFQHKDKARRRSHEANGHHGPWDGNALLEQVWFSGTHSHVGGGLDSENLSAIAFGWMASQLTKYDLLDLDPDYLLKDVDQDRSSDPWATKSKVAALWINAQSRIELINRLNLLIYNFLYWVLALFTINRITSRFMNMGGVRTPGRYKAKPANRRTPPDQFVTNEYLHSSIDDRNLKSQVTTSSWPCIALRGWKRGDERMAWTSPELLLDKPIQMNQAKVGDVENRCKNNVRDIHKDTLITKSASKGQNASFSESVEDNDMAGRVVNGF